MSRKYKFDDQGGVYFVSFAVVGWVDVFIRREYKDLFIDSLVYCCRNKGLVIYAYVIMSSHVHLLLARSNEGQTLEGILRDLKKFTAGKLLRSIRENPQESRKEWMTAIFSEAGQINSNNKYYQFWQQNNHPLQVNEQDNVERILDYIHNNPVEAGWVESGEDFWYSSA